MMERLTQKFDSGAWGIRGSIDDAVLRLAAYEDSGLSPVEIYRLKREKDRAAAGMSREQVGKVWRGEWIFHPDDLFPAEAMFECKECHEFFALRGPGGEKFCPECGRAMTDEAVEIVVERLEALKDGKGD